LTSLALLKLNKTSFILNETDSQVQLNFGIALNCAMVDYSSFSCFRPSKTDAITPSSTSATCATGSLSEPRNNIYLGWGNTNYRISENVTIYRIYSQYLSYANGTSAGIVGKDMLVKIKLEKPISKEIHNTLRCFIPSGANATAVTLNGKDDEISCLLPVEKNNSVNSGNLVDLKYINLGKIYSVSKSPLYIVSFGIQFQSKISSTINEFNFFVWVRWERK
jgi:hypothetical protein